jgi:hypothetical protein
MDILIQLGASYGPIALGLMGILVSAFPDLLKRPMRLGRYAHWLWVAAFFVVGVWTATASFIEVRSSDAFQKVIADRLGVDPNSPKQTITDEIIKRLQGPRNPDTFYQDGRPIAKVAGMTLDVPANPKFASFQAVTSEREIDFNKEMELQGVRLLCRSGGASGMLNYGAVNQFTYTDVACQILGPRK